MKDKKTIILKTLVGSHAHGLATPESDRDYRGVYITPTSEILSLGYNYKGSHWLEGEEDNTSYEIGHFLFLATKCNPSILEVFKAPVSYEGYNTSLGYYIELKDLFQYVWNPQGAYNAFVGYGLNQRKKMLDNHLDRWAKYGVAYIRTLYNLIDLLKTGSFDLKIPECDFKEEVRRIRSGAVDKGSIINLADRLTELAKVQVEKHLDGTASFKQEANIEKVNEFLLKIRQDFWS
jgi:hypothetical protein